MYQLALLKAENQNLREANKTLSKRRRAKKTRIRLRGLLTIDEARDILDQ